MRTRSYSRGCERSQDPGRLQRTTLHLWTNSATPVGLRQPSAFGSDWRRSKVRLTFRLHTASPVKDWPKYASLSASQWLSRSGIARHPLHIRWMQTCLQTIGLALPRSNLEGLLKCQLTCLSQRKYSQLVKDQGEDVPSAHLRPAI